MKTVTYKLHKKNEFIFQVKDGRKVLETISKTSGGWYCACKTFETVESAIEWFKELRYSARQSFSSEPLYIKVV